MVNALGVMVSPFGLPLQVVGTHPVLTTVAYMDIPCLFSFPSDDQRLILSAAFTVSYFEVNRDVERQSATLRVPRSPDNVYVTLSFVVIMPTFFPRDFVESPPAPRCVRFMRRFFRALMDRARSRPKEERFKPPEVLNHEKETTSARNIVPYAFSFTRPLRIKVSEGLRLSLSG